MLSFLKITWIGAEKRWGGYFWDVPGTDPVHGDSGDGMK
jgi:hypothetical protein